MAETNSWEDLPDEEKQRAQEAWEAARKPEMDKRLGDWQEEVVETAMKRIMQKIGPTLGAVSQQGGMAAFYRGMSDKEIPFLEKALEGASPENIIAASQDPSVLETYQNSARFQATKAEAEATPEPTETTTEPTKEMQPKMDDSGNAVKDDKGEPVMEEKPPELSAENQKAADWVKKNFVNPDTGQPMELPQEAIERAIGGETEGIMSKEMV